MTRGGATVRTLVALWIAVATLARAETRRAEHHVLEPGLDLHVFTASRPAALGDSKIYVLRIDPGRFDLRLLNVSANPHERPRTVKSWVHDHGLVAGINASMYQQDYRTSVSLMRTRDHVNQGRLSKDNAVLAFDRLDDSVPPVQIIDRTCQDFDALKGRYGTLVQSIRMVSCKRENVWSPQPKVWSTAAIAMDGHGAVLFVHVPSLYRTHDLINELLELPVDLRNTMYVEGGVPAQLYVKSGSFEIELLGREGTGLFGGETESREIPNIIGVVRRGAVSAEQTSSSVGGNGEWHNLGVAHTRCAVLETQVQPVVARWVGALERPDLRAAIDHAIGGGNSVALHERRVGGGLNPDTGAGHIAFKIR